MTTWLRQAQGLALVLLLGLTACGGGGGGGGDSAPPPAPPPPEPSGVALDSDAGDIVGSGRGFRYSQADARLRVSYSGAQLQISIEGDEGWDGLFVLPANVPQLAVGRWTGLPLAPAANAALGGLSWRQNGRGCAARAAGIVEVQLARFSGNALVELRMSFEQRCDNQSGALRGRVYWRADDPTRPPLPAAVPAGLWAPAAGTVPSSGNLVHVETSEAGAAAPRRVSMTPLDAVISQRLAADELTLSGSGNDAWSMTLRAPEGQALQVGHYTPLRSENSSNPTRAQLQVNAWRDSSYCAAGPSWLAIDEWVLNGGALERVALRFERQCGGGTVWRGQWRWSAQDQRQPPGPEPIPAALWRAPADALPVDGVGVYLEGSSGEPKLGAGRISLTPANALITLRDDGGRLALGIEGDTRWSATLRPMQPLRQLQVGYYPAQVGLGSNPALASLTWDHCGIDGGRGWFAVDAVQYSASGALERLDLRFEQRCAAADAPPLRGQLRWRPGAGGAGNPQPMPAGLWQPAAGIVPASGNAVYLESLPGDFIGGGRNYLYTAANAQFNALSEGSGRGLAFNVSGDEDWRGVFLPPVGSPQLQLGYYGSLRRAPFSNPALGGVEWTGEGRGCNALSGWFVVDAVRYEAGALVDIDLRFEQRCENVGPPLRGRIRWSARDTTPPPGPQQPPPADLWRAPSALVPASGNYVVLESQAGDYIGAGRTEQYLAPRDSILLSGNGAQIRVQVGGWDASFVGMNTLPRLQPGYYGQLQRHPFHNPVRGGLSWSGNGRGCNELEGWFVVDEVIYAGVDLERLVLRFEQRCEKFMPPLRGQLRWSRGG